MPRHPPYALENLPHDHRTHRPTTHPGHHHNTSPTTGEGPQQHHDRQPAAITNHENVPHHPPPRRAGTSTASSRCSRPLYSSQTTTHTPHTEWDTTAGHLPARGKRTRTAAPPQGAGTNRNTTPPHPYRPAGERPRNTRDPHRQHSKSMKGLLSQDPTVRQGPHQHQQHDQRSTTPTAPKNPEGRY